MTPSQLRSFAAIVRCGSVGVAATRLGISQAAVSSSVAALRRELGDELFRPSNAGLRFTDGGQALARRANEILQLQETTKREVTSAGERPPLVRLATTSMFAEYAAPGLIECHRTADAGTEVELTVESTYRFEDLLHDHLIDVAIGPRFGESPAGLQAQAILHGEVVAVCHPSVATSFRTQPWHLGPSALEAGGVSSFILSRSGTQPGQRRFWPNHAAAMTEALAGRGVALAPSFAVVRAIRRGDLVRIDDEDTRTRVSWTAFVLADTRQRATIDFFETAMSQRASTMMVSTDDAPVGEFSQRAHVTRWANA